MNNNNGGTFQTSREEALAIYDRLPPKIRAALREAAFEYAPQTVVNSLKFLDEDGIVALIEAEDKRRRSLAP